MNYESLHPSIINSLLLFKKGFVLFVWKVRFIWNAWIWIWSIQISDFHNYCLRLEKRTSSFVLIIVFFLECRCNSRLKYAALFICIIYLVRATSLTIAIVILAIIFINSNRLTIYRMPMIAFNILAIKSFIIVDWFFKRYSENFRYFKLFPLLLLYKLHFLLQFDIKIFY